MERIYFATEEWDSPAGITVFSKSEPHHSRFIKTRQAERPPGQLLHNHLQEIGHHGPVLRVGCGAPGEWSSDRRLPWTDLVIDVQPATSCGSFEQARAARSAVSYSRGRGYSASRSRPLYCLWIDGHRHAYYQTFPPLNALSNNADFWLVSEPVFMAEKYKQHLVRWPSLSFPGLRSVKKCNETRSLPQAHTKSS